MNRTSKGFTLIELMIVVAIVGILAAIALPAYQDYIARAKVSEIMARLAAFKTSVSEYAATESAIPANANAAGIDTTDTGGYISAIAYSVSGSTGTVSITPQNINSTVDAGTISFEFAYANNKVTTTCVASSTGMYKYLPANCRNAASP